MYKDQDHPWGEKKHPRPLFYSLHDNMCVCATSLQPCPTLHNPMDCSPPGFSLHGILQAGILEWIALASSKGSSQPRN